MRILLILLFISFSGFSQTYDDMMSIKDLNSFKRIVIENNYRYDRTLDEIFVHYLKIGDRGGAYYLLEDGGFYFIYAKEVKGILETETPYDKIYRQVKNKCEFDGIQTYRSNDYACYECEDAKFKGVLGFTVDNSGWAYVHQFSSLNKE